MENQGKDFATSQVSQGFCGETGATSQKLR